MKFIDNWQHTGWRHATVVALLACCCITATAQRVALKTNALYWATASPNLGLELRVNRHITFNVEGTFNRLKAGKFDTRAEIVNPEVRYWFSARPQAGHFLGVAAVVSNYNLLIDHQRHNGDLAGGGLTYGYSFVLGRHWSLEATVGGGMVYRREKNYDERDNQQPTTANLRKWQPFPLKAGVSFVYIIK